MKKIFTTVIMACVAAVSAMAVTVSDASGVYQGNLNIGGDEYPNEEVYILPGVTANTITFVLPNFKFSGVSLGDIVLVNIPMNVVYQSYPDSCGGVDAERKPDQRNNSECVAVY